MKTRPGRSLVVGAAALACALIAPATAAAEKLCYNTADCPGGSMFTTGGLQDALNAAASSPGETEVVVGPGTYTPTSGTGYRYTPPAGNNPLIFTGSGDATILQGDETTNGPWTTLAIATGPGIASIVRRMKILVPKKSTPSGSTRVGLELHYATAEDVTVEDRGDAQHSVSLESGGVLRRVRVTTADNGTGLYVSSGAGTAHVDDSVLTGGRAAIYATSDADVAVRRSGLTARYAAVHVLGGKMRIESSVLRVTGAPAVFGEGPAALLAQTGSGKPASIDALHVTAVGPGSADSDGVRARSDDAGQPSAVVLDSSILHGFGTALRGKPNPGPYAISTRYSDYAAGTSSLPAGGSATEGPGNIDADPLFVDPATFDYDLRAGSPAIDAGNPGATRTSDTDLRSRPRVVDGNGDGSPVPDMGAFEAPTPAPIEQQPPSEQPGAGNPLLDTIAPVVSGLRVRRVIVRVAGRRRVRHRLRFVVSEPAALTVRVERAARGRRVRGRCRARATTGRRCTRWVFKKTVRKNAAAAGVKRVLLPALRRGRYRLTVRATDAAGNRSARRRITFRRR